MSDPIGLVGLGRMQPGLGTSIQGPGAQGPSFKDVLLDNLKRANQLEQDATRAIEDLTAGRRDDVESVILATQKADNAFRMLQAVRNKVMQAVEEVKQIRV